MSLKSVNLNLIPVLRELLRHQSVTAAARELGRSPTAISEGLAKLRATFGDPLLVRSGGRMVLTARAAELIDPVTHACEYLEEIINRDRFDPASSRRTFLIAAPDYSIFAVGPEIVDHITNAAPHIRIRFVDVDLGLPEQMANREVDFAIIPDFLLEEMALTAVRSIKLFEDEVVVVMHRDHPLAVSDVIDEQQIAVTPQVAFHSNWQPIDHQIAAVAHRRRIPPNVQIADAMLLPYFLARGRMIALAPRRISARLGDQFDLTSRPLAVKERPVRGVLAWNVVQDTDPAHRWFRDQIAGALLGRDWPYF